MTMLHLAHVPHHSKAYNYIVMWKRVSFLCVNTWMWKLDETRHISWQNDENMETRHDRKYAVSPYFHRVFTSCFHYVSMYWYYTLRLQVFTYLRFFVVNAYKILRFCSLTWAINIAKLNKYLILHFFLQSQKLQKKNNTHKHLRYIIIPVSLCCYVTKNSLEDEKTPLQREREDILLRELLDLIDERDDLERKKVALSRKWDDHFLDYFPGELMNSVFCLRSRKC